MNNEQNRELQVFEHEENLKGGVYSNLISDVHNVDTLGGKHDMGDYCHFVGYDGLYAVYILEDPPVVDVPTSYNQDYIEHNFDDFYI